MASLRYYPIMCLEEERKVTKIGQALCLVSNLRSELGVLKCEDRRLPHTNLQQTLLACDQIGLRELS